MVPKACRDMIKSRRIACEMMKVRLERQSKLKNTVYNSADIQVVGSDCLGFFPTLLVNSEGRTYMFNCSEGTQRLCHANKVKIINVENIFITNRVWDRVSGLHGLSLTLQDTGLPRLIAHSDDELKGFFESTSNFASYQTGMTIETRSYLEGEYKDSGLCVRPIPIESGSPNSGAKQSDTQVIKKLKFQTILIAYDCSTPDQAGPLDPEKCRQLKVPVGPLLAKLKSGADVTLPDGKLVKSSDVCGPKLGGTSFLIIDCPEEKYIDAVIKNASLDNLRNFRKSVHGRQVDIVIHFSSESVTNDPKYRDWMNGFDPTCQHLLLSSKTKAINFIESYRLQYLLKKIDNELFPNLPLPKEVAKRVESELSSENNGDDLRSNVTPELVVKEFPNQSCNVIETSSCDRITLRPHVSMEVDESPFNIDLLYKQAKSLPNFEEKLSILREIQQGLSKPKDHEPELVILGSSSAVPSKLRNTSCILLNFQLPIDASVILDCGEDSYGQLCRFYGDEKLKDVLKRLKFIYVSHHHADHHLGLIRLLEHRRKLTEKPLALLLPPGIDKFLDYHNKNFENLSESYKIFSTVAMKVRPSIGQFSTASSDYIKSDLFDMIGNLLDDIEIVSVDHCINACGAVFKFKIGHPEMDTFSVAYSGDLRPSEEFILIGKDCDLLIHEATFDHRSQEEALIKKHSTSTEAIQVSRNMNAKFTMLTHFSRRLPKIPYFTEDFDEKIGFAFDNMAVRCPTHFARVPIMKDVLRIVFEKSYSELDTRYFRSKEKHKLMQDIIEKASRDRLQLKSPTK